MSTNLLQSSSRSKELATPFTKEGSDYADLSDERFIVTQPFASRNLVFFKDLARDDLDDPMSALYPITGRLSRTDVSRSDCFLFLSSPFLYLKASLVDRKVNLLLIISFTSDNSSAVSGYNSLLPCMTWMACHKHKMGKINSKGGIGIPCCTSSIKYHR